jgi:hypothetical protein
MVPWFLNMPSERVFTSVIVLREVRRGIELVARREKLLAEVLERWYASIREQLANRILAAGRKADFTPNHNQRCKSKVGHTPKVVKQANGNASA